MQYQKIGSNYCLRLLKGEEVINTITELCKKENIKAGYLTGIGATNDVEIGLFNTQEKKYYSNNLKGDREITSLIGNISTKDNEVYLHLHISVADESGTTFGGHLTKCIVSATLEIIITVFDKEINRKFDPEIGLNMWEFSLENR